MAKRRSSYEGIEEELGLVASTPELEVETPTPAAPQAPATQPRRQASRGRGRPAGGKSSNPDYMQVSAFVPKKLYAEINIGLLREGMRTGKKRDFSDLLEKLLSDWNKKNSD
jgi:hypothetical protein